MKNTYRLDLVLFGIVYLVVLFLITSCEQEEAVVEMNTAPGGGTVTTYKAYELGAATADEVYGRVVFYKDNADNTLVEVGLYNTIEEQTYNTAFYNGALELGSAETLMPLYEVNGATGSFSPSKFYVIKDKTFFDNLESFDAHFKVMTGEQLVSIGNVGKNALPVAEAD